MAKNDVLTKYTVEEVINRFPDRTLYIGAGAGYLWIGKGADASFALKCLNKKHRDIRARSIEKGIASIAHWEAQVYTLTNSLDGLSKKKAKDREAEIELLKHKITKTQASVARLKGYLRKMKSMTKRRVRDIYVRPVMQEQDILGISVLMEGDEIGDYWNMQEFNKNPRGWLCK